MHSEFGPMSPQALEILEGFLHRIQQPRSQEQYAARVGTYAQALTSGKPPKELWYLTAAIALIAAADCERQEADKPSLIGERPQPRLVTAG